MAVVAGVDSSTQSCTVELRDADSGALLGSGRAPHPRTTPPVSEQDAESWWDALRSAFGAALRDASLDAREVDAISVAAQCHGLVMLDGSGHPLRPVKLWNDTTSAPQSDLLIAELGTAAWTRAVGSVPLAAFTITKLAWVQEHEPQLLDRLARVMVPHDYLTWRLSGRHVTDRSDASGTGYYASHESRWRTDLLDRFVSDRVDWAAVVPTVLGPDEAAGPISPAAAAELGVRDDVVIGPGAGDQHAGAAGLGMRDGEVAYSLGTSGVVLTPTPDPVFDDSGDVNGVSNVTGGYLPLVCTLNATKVTDTVARLLGVGLDELAALALAAPDRPGRPVLSAYFDGERSPNRPGGVGILGGLSNETTREELAAAAFEGVLFGLVRGHERIRAAGAGADGEVLVMGGGAKSPAYRQLLADVLGSEVVIRDVPEATARGAAIQAAAVLEGGSVAAVRDAWAPPVVERDAPRGSGWAAAARERYETLSSWTGLDR
ncbi:xylulokinase [Salinibacterium soli]|uniref:Xylulose kinase n=1 Tax=Antiquaquibacter soli TaxID=3064523 RepID=A0ABT9BI12_9MICO|nr:xylulokinase [Protaetiibacter sp. WY-16]MDO7880656.1 xylulokinase [Protaetiibacter sp. WY-16]